MTVAEIAKMIYDYGSAVVLLAVLIVAIVWFAKGFKKVNDDHAAENVQHRKEIEDANKRLTALTEVVMNITKASVNTYPVHTKEQEAESRQFDKFLNLQLQELRDNTKASRAAYIAYHNGGASITGRPFARCSVIAEKVDVKTPLIASGYQNYQRAIIGAICDKMDTDRYFFCADVETLQDNAAKAILKDWKAKSCYCCAVVDNINDMVVGFVIIQFNKPLETEYKKIKDEIRVVATAIAGAVQLNANHEGEN